MLATVTPSPVEVVTPRDAPAWVPAQPAWLPAGAPVDELEPLFRANFAARTGLIDRVIPYRWAWPRVRRGLRRAAAGDPVTRAVIDREAFVLVKRKGPARWYLYGAVSLQGIGATRATDAIAAFLVGEAQGEGITDVEMLVMILPLARRYRAYGFSFTAKPWTMRVRVDEVAARLAARR